MECDNRLEFFIIIANRKKKNALVTLLIKTGARVVNTVYGKTSVKASSITDVFGFIPEENKIIIISLLKGDKSSILIETLNKEFDFDKPNTGIAFTIPVEGLSY